MIAERGRQIAPFDLGHLFAECDARQFFFYLFLFFGVGGSSQPVRKLEKPPFLGLFSFDPALNELDEQMARARLLRLGQRADASRQRSWQRHALTYRLLVLLHASIILHSDAVCTTLHQVCTKGHRFNRAESYVNGFSYSRLLSARCIRFRLRKSLNGPISHSVRQFVIISLQQTLATSAIRQQFSGGYPEWFL